LTGTDQKVPPTDLFNKKVLVGIAQVSFIVFSQKYFPLSAIADNMVNIHKIGVMHPDYVHFSEHFIIVLEVSGTGIFAVSGCNEIRAVSIRRTHDNILNLKHIKSFQMWYDQGFRLI